jgi:hypothetical protein
LCEPAAGRFSRPLALLRAARDSNAGAAGCKTLVTRVGAVPDPLVSDATYVLCAVSYLVSGGRLTPGRDRTPGRRARGYCG